MAQHKQTNLDQILFENVSFQIEGLDPVLNRVDLDFPMDQTVIVQSSNPTHAVHLLEILAGRKEPQTGKVRWTDTDALGAEELSNMLHEVVACYFESHRPSPEITVQELLVSSQAPAEVITAAVEHFELRSLLKKKFRQLTFENQKLVLLLLPTLKTPQMLVLEDPAPGLSEKVFLAYLDWIQLWQRQGHLRHIYLTNNHPAAARHLDASVLHVEDGLIYIEDDEIRKKIVHF